MVFSAQQKPQQAASFLIFRNLHRASLLVTPKACGARVSPTLAPFILPSWDFQCFSSRESPNLTLGFITIYHLKLSHKLSIIYTICIIYTIYIIYSIRYTIIYTILYTIYTIIYPSKNIPRAHFQTSSSAIFIIPGPVLSDELLFEFLLRPEQHLVDARGLHPQQFSYATGEAQARGNVFAEISEVEVRHVAAWNQKSSCLMDVDGCWWLMLWDSSYPKKNRSPCSPIFVLSISLHSHQQNQQKQYPTELFHIAVPRPFHVPSTSHLVLPS